MKNLKTPVEEPYWNLLTDVLNVVFGNNDLSEKYWLENIRTNFLNKFCKHLEPSFVLSSFSFVKNDFRNQFAKPWKYIKSADTPIDYIFIRLKTMLGCTFSPRIEQHYNKLLLATPKPFSIFDVRTLDGGDEDVPLAVRVGLGRRVAHECVASVAGRVVSG